MVSGGDGRREVKDEITGFGVSQSTRKLRRITTINPLRRQIQIRDDPRVRIYTTNKRQKARNAKSTREAVTFTTPRN
jgi:hypothetical protein